MTVNFEVLQSVYIKQKRIKTKFAIYEKWTYLSLGQSCFQWNIRKRP